MGWRSTVRILCLCLALPGLIGSMVPAHAWSGSPPAESRIRVWTFVTGTLDPAERDRATQVADELLRTAGVSVDWHPCDVAASCTRGGPAEPSVTVILMSAARPTCGLTAFGPDRTSATVLVSVPCVAGILLDLRRQVGAHPLVATLEVRHLLGGVLAHEIGHVLGLKHAARGIMRARLEIDDVLALRAGRLVFSPPEAATMRASRLCDGLIAGRARYTP